MTFNFVTISLLKFTIFVFMLYEGWFIPKFSAIPFVLQCIALSIILLTGLLVKDKIFNYFDRTLFFWGLFGFVSAISAELFMQDSSFSLMSLTTYFSFLIIIYCVGVVCKEEKNINWFENIFLACLPFILYSSIIQGQPYFNGHYTVITMGPNNNPNGLGLIMSMGVFFLLMLDKDVKMMELILRVVLAFMCLYVVVNTGSRSSLLCSIAVLSLFFYRKYKSKSILYRSIFVVSAFVVLFLCHLFFESNLINYIDSGGFRRLLENFTESAYSGRTNLYESALMYYFENPIFGIGYNFFTIISGFGYYTHSTYMELLSCTGSIGFLLFMYPVFKGYVNSFYNINFDNGKSFTFISLILVSGFFTITFYTALPFIALYVYILKNQLITEFDIKSKEY